jgi:hypothetical protein
MNSTVIVNIFRFILLLAVQVVFFNNMSILGYISPFPYMLFIILFPVNGNKYWLLITSFLLGFVMDLFCNSGGIHAMACLTLAFIRPQLFKFAFGLSYEYQTVKLNDVLSPERFSFILMSVVVHHFILFLIEAFQFEFFVDVVLRAVFSAVFTILTCIIIIYLIKPNKR